MHDNKVINELKEKIKKEKKKIKEGKKKIRKEKSKILNVLNKINLFKNEKKETYNFVEVIIVMFFSLGLGFFACFSFIKIFSGGKDYMALSKDLEKVVDTYYAIVDNYYGDLDKDALVDAAVRGMISSVGDVYTNYSDSDTTDAFNETVGGTYEGIGATVGMNAEGQILIMGIFDDGPAAKSGLEVDDVILKIDGEDYTDKTSVDVADYVKNSNKEQVVFTILRGEEEKEIIVKLSKIEIPTITSEMFEKNNKKIGYISIDIFSSVTNTQFKETLEKLEKEKIEGLVIDVRDNGGGYLNVVTDITSMFLEKGKIIYQLENSKSTTSTKDKTKEHRTYPVAVLVNGASASASEILAAAIKESYNGFVVGTNTYGKGTVQQTTTLPDGSMVKYTVENWLTPDGNWLNETGLEPTNIIELDSSYYENPSCDSDNQLQKALDLVSN